MTSPYTASSFALTPEQQAGAIEWRCGHPRTDENTKVVRAGEGRTCLQCFRKLNRDYMRRKRGTLAANYKQD